MKTLKIICSFCFASNQAQLYMSHLCVNAYNQIQCLGLGVHMVHISSKALFFLDRSSFSKEISQKQAKPLVLSDSLKDSITKSTGVASKLKYKACCS